MPGRKGDSGTWRKVSRCVECNHKVTVEEKMYSRGCCPYCGHLNKGTVLATNDAAEEVTNLRVAWTVFKLKVVRALLKPLLGLHIWFINRGKDMDRLEDDDNAL